MSRNFLNCSFCEAEEAIESYKAKEGLYNAL